MCTFKEIGIIDYGMGNLTSVTNAFRSLGFRVRLLSSPAQLNATSHIVLPGVGAFGVAMKNLRIGEWLVPLRDAVFTEGKPFLGICLGLQLLATYSEEFGRNEGLAWVPGCVRMLTPNDAHLHVPHIGWNEVSYRDGQSELFTGIIDEPDFYFVHSFHFDVEDTNVITSTCDYGGHFTASIQHGNIFATQFHPEKSGTAGLRLLSNFASYSVSNPAGSC